MPANTIITVRKGSSSAWVSANPVLASGELGFDTTNNILKIGNGTSDWNSLSNHRHSSADITNFNSSVSGLLPVKDIVASSGINIFSVSGIYTISSPGVVASSGGNSGYLSKFTASNTIDDSIIYQSSDNIGIGTTTPSGKLHVVGTGIFDSGIFIPNNVSIRTSTASGSQFNILRLDTADNVRLERPSASSDMYIAASTAFILKGNDRVGMGHVSPLNRLAVNGATTIGSSNNVAAPTNGLLVEGSVGIGTTTPSGKLHIGSGDLHFDASYGLRWAGGSRLYEERVGVAGGSAERMLYLPNGDRFEVLSENGVEILMGIHGANSLLANSNRFRRAIGIGNNYGSSGTLPFNGLAVQGNVGIGTQSPIAPLHVIGSGVYSTSDSSSIITIDPSGRSIDCNPSAFSDISLKANNQFIFRGLDGWTGTWADSGITTYFQIGRNAGNTIFTSLQGAPFTRLAYSANKILFTNTGSSLSIPSGYFTINTTINGGSVGTSGLVIDTTHSSSAANGQSHGALVVTPLFNSVGSNLNNIYGAYISPRHSGVYTTTNSYGLYVNAATNITGTITNNYAAVFSGGNVGVGTATPQTLIHGVGSSTGVGSLFRLQNTSSSNNTYFETRIGTSGNFDDYIFFNRNGTNFFGATNNSELFFPNTTRLASNKPIVADPNSNAVLNLYNASAQTDLGYVSGNALRFLRSYVEVARFDGSGNFGIGTTAPAQKLDVRGNIYASGNISGLSGIFSNITFQNILPVNNLPVGSSSGLGVIKGGSGIIIENDGTLKFQLVTLTASDWSIANPILASGQPGFDITNGILKVGNGSGTWTSLNSINSNYLANRGIINTSGLITNLSIPGGYAVGAIDIFINGVKIINGVDYTANNGYAISFSNPIPSGNTIEYISLSALNGAGIVTDQYSSKISRDIIVATGTINSININDGYNIGGLDIYKNGLKLTKNIDYVANDGTTVSFNNPQPSGSIIEYVSFIPGKARRSINTVSVSVSAGNEPQTDYIYVATQSITVTMPSASGNNNRYTVKSLTTQPVSVAPYGSQTIDNQNLITIIDQYTSIDLVSNGQNWIII